MIIQSIVQSVMQPVVQSVINPLHIHQSGFSPASLFGNGEQGAWYDPSDLLTLFQDAAGTTPVTGAGQVVGLMRDKSGRGNHAAQASDGSKPILRNSGFLWYLEFDGVDDFLVTSAINFSAIDKMSVFAGIRKSSDAGAAIAVELSNTSSTTNAGSFGLLVPVSAAGRVAFQSRGTITVQAQQSVATPAPTTFVVSGISAIANVTLGLRVEGLAVGSSSADQGSGNYGNYPMYIGRRGGSSLPFNGNLYGLIVRGAMTDAKSIAQSETYIATKSGVAL
jgi:hypothetical protein